MLPPATSAYWSRVAGVSEPRSTSTSRRSSRYSVGARRLEALPFFAIARDGSVPRVRKPTRHTRGGPRRTGAARDLAAAPAARPPRRPALQRVGAAGGRRDRARRHRHARPRLDGAPRAGARAHGPPARGRAADRHHPRPHRPLRPGAAARRARRLRGLDAPRLGTARRDSDLDRTSRSRCQSGVPEEPLRRFAERRRASGSGQAGALHSDRDLRPGRDDRDRRSAPGR